MAASKVRAHRRRGTRGVRRHLRFVENTSRPRTTLHIHRRDVDPELDARLEEHMTLAFMPTSKAAGTREYATDTNSIYLVREDAQNPTEDNLSHEELHAVLNHLEGERTSRALDRALSNNMDYQWLGKRIPGGI
jgi:hypothetical protein